MKGVLFTVRFCSFLTYVKDINGLTDVHIAELIGIDRKTISKHRRGLAFPHFETFQMYFDLFKEMKTPIIKLKSEKYNIFSMYDYFKKEEDAWKGSKRK